MNLSKYPRTIVMLTMFGVTLTPHLCNACPTVSPSKHAPEVVIPTQIQTFVEALVAKWAPACNLTEDEQRCVTLLTNHDTCKTPMPLAPVRSALNKFCNNVKKASKTVYGATAQELEKVCDYCTLCVDWVSKAMHDHRPSVRSCTCPDMMEFFGSSEPLFACLLLVKRLMVQDELVVNGTACFNGLVTFCGNVSGLSGLSGSGGQGPPGPQGATGPTGPTGPPGPVCLCWNGQLCTGLMEEGEPVLFSLRATPQSRSITFPVECMLSSGIVLFNALSANNVNVVAFSDTNKDNVDSRCKLIGIEEGDLIRVYDADNKATYADIRVEKCESGEGYIGYAGFNVGGDGLFNDNACLCLENFGPDQSPCLCWMATTDTVDSPGDIAFDSPDSVTFYFKTLDGTDADCTLSCICTGDRLRFCAPNAFPNPIKRDVEAQSVIESNNETRTLIISQDLNGVFPAGTVVCFDNFGPAQSSSGVATPCLCWNVNQNNALMPGEIRLSDDNDVAINFFARDNVDARCFLFSINENDCLRFSPSCTGGTGASVDAKVTSDPMIDNIDSIVSFTVDQTFSPNFGDCACLQNFGPAQNADTGTQSPCLCWSGTFTTPFNLPDIGEVTWNNDDDEFVFNTQAKDGIDASCALLQLKNGDCVRLTNINDPDSPESCLHFVVNRIFSNPDIINVLYQSVTPNPSGLSGCWCLQNFGQKSRSWGQVVAFDHEIITSVPCCNSGVSGLSGCSGLVGIVNAGGPEQAILRGLSLSMVIPDDTLISLEQSQAPGDYTGIRIIRFGFPGTYEVTWNAHIASDSLVEKGALPYPTPESSQRVLLGLQLTDESGVLLPDDSQPLGALNMIPLADIVASNVGSRAENLQPVLQAPLTVGSNFLVNINNPNTQALKFVGAKEGNDDPFTNVGLVAQDPRGTFFEQNTQNLSECTGISTRNIAAFVATIKRIGNASVS